MDVKLTMVKDPSIEMSSLSRKWKVDRDDVKIILIEFILFFHSSFFRNIIHSYQYQFHSTDIINRR